MVDGKHKVKTQSKTIKRVVSCDARRRLSVCQTTTSRSCYTRQGGVLTQVKLVCRVVVVFVRVLFVVAVLVVVVIAVVVVQKPS